MHIGLRAFLSYHPSRIRSYQRMGKCGPGEGSFEISNPEMIADSQTGSWEGNNDKDKLMTRRAKIRTSKTGQSPAEPAERDTETTTMTYKRQNGGSTACDDGGRPIAH